MSMNTCTTIQFYYRCQGDWCIRKSVVFFYSYVFSSPDTPTPDIPDHKPSQKRDDSLWKVRTDCLSMT